MIHPGKTLGHQLSVHVNSVNIDPSHKCARSGQPPLPLHGSACELTETAENAVLEGQLTSGIFIRGNDVVNVVPLAGEVTTCADVWEFSRPARPDDRPMTADTTSK